MDDISYDFVKGASVDYEEELIRSAFVVSFKILVLNFLQMFVRNTPERQLSQVAGVLPGQDTHAHSNGHK